MSMQVKLQKPGPLDVWFTVCAPSKATTQSQELPLPSHVQAPCLARPVPTAQVESDIRVLLVSMGSKKV
ncbi:hypothetical protein V7S43_018667 [Phytophthora oleae]|uniref:Uncharacterized protein n=1 Tax=Phytophthora oleae TaxID=2107226 RepID=A0ABD3EQ89_9STRA